MEDANLAVFEQPATVINNLHKEIRGHGNTMVQIAIKAGGLLVEEKARLGHGMWLPWVVRDLTFSPRTAQFYIKCYQNRDLLNTKSVSHLGKAVSLLATPKEELSVHPVPTKAEPIQEVVKKKATKARSFPQCMWMTSI